MLLLAVSSAGATSVSNARTIRSVDVVSAGVGGLGAGTGTIVLGGVSGTVLEAILYWHGINTGDSGGDGTYDNATVSFNGQNVTGFSLGDASTNCWTLDGSGSSRAYRADVTDLVPGNGSYTVGGLAAIPGNNGNGASLVVIFDDHDPGNNRDLVFFEGNDSTVTEGFPGEEPGWAATLADVNHAGGKVFAEVHVSDGENAPDGDLVFSSTGGAVTIRDSNVLYDGVSVPNNGTGRSSNGSLWDIHRFEITGAFKTSGPTTLSVNGLEASSDCLALVALILDMPAGEAPCGAGAIEEGESCDPAAQPTSCAQGTCLLNCTCGCTSDEQCDDVNACTTDVCAAGVCSHTRQTPPSAACLARSTPTTTLPEERCAGKDCSDGNPCTDDVCDPGTGTCSNTVMADGTACDDDNACTDTSTCQAGACAAGAAACSVDFSTPHPGKPVKVAVRTVPGGPCEGELFELVPSGQTSSVPAGFGIGRPFSKAVHKRARKQGKQSGRVTMRLKLNHAGLTALKKAPGGQLPVLGRVTITEPGGPQRIVDELITLRRKSKGR
jgi:hypothetical protein